MPIDRYSNGWEATFAGFDDLSQKAKTLLGRQEKHMTPTLLREAGWSVVWYEKFDMNNDDLEPADFYRGKAFATKAAAEKFAKRIAPHAIPDTVEVREDADDDA